MAKCGVCNFKGGSEEYLAHKCSTGFRPTNIKHQDALTGGRFSRMANKAIQRGTHKLDVKKQKEKSSGTR